LHLVGGRGLETERLDRQRGSTAAGRLADRVADLDRVVGVAAIAGGVVPGVAGRNAGHTGAVVVRIVRRLRSELLVRVQQAAADAAVLRLAGVVVAVVDHVRPAARPHVRVLAGVDDADADAGTGDAERVLHVV